MLHSPALSKHSYTTLFLYRVVFCCKPVVYVLCLLVTSFLLQPIEQAFAAPEDSGQTEEAGPVVVAESLAGADSTVSAVTEESSLSDPALLESSEAAQESVVEVLPEATPTPLEEPTVPSTNEVSTTSPIGGSASSTTTGETVDDGGETVSDEASMLATSTTLDLPLVHNTFNDNELRFDKDQCSLVADGSYYCRPKTVDTSIRDGLIAAPDKDGDLEIFAVRDGDYIQLTFNTTDDASPYYDSESNTMVWHRLIDDRYQIFSYDFETGRESQFTEGDVNDMEPTRYGDYTVWQRWVDGYWQIMLDNGVVVMQLSKDITHNIAPNIRGQIIIWQTKGLDGEQQLQTYDLLTKSYVTITDNEDASMINPRMMMVYEAVYETGEVVTRGFDMLTGKVVPLHTIPSDLPDSLPDSDSTGETRALIQTKPAVKEMETENDSGPQPPPPQLPQHQLASSTLTLDLSTASSSASTTTLDVPSPAVPDLQFDLYIPASSTQMSSDS